MIFAECNNGLLTRCDA